MAFAPSKSKRHMDDSAGELNMNSMMDMMTIILLFLLKSFSTEGSLVTASEELKLPESLLGEKPQKELNVSVTAEEILINNNLLMKVATIDPQNALIDPLYRALALRAQEEKQLEIDYGTEFKHAVIIQGDQGISFEMLFKIMYTCSKSEYYKMHLLTIKKG